ncbi:NAD(P)-dependent oxidoreductase [Elioraea sp.]|uniref:NAD-dependent epimerase/dehydratase family protein n=1 Tax=Elioraea sp. TaxID=2185103 RepID=UPI0025C3D8C1|nr:NAD(P)-dependent oxidoreductase [Elioraea sp.]
MIERLLVIGGGGFLGSRVLRAAVARGMACASFGPAGRDLAAGLAITRFAGEGQEGGALAAALVAFRPDAVIWAAGHNPTGDGLARTAEADVARAAAVNAGAFAATLAACAAAGIARVVQCGSTVVYGPATDYGAARVDEAAPPAPRTAYGLTKLMAEQAAQWGAAALGLDVVTLRLPLVLGPGRWYAGAAGSYARMLRAAADGRALREEVSPAAFDAVHGDDAAAALLLLAGLRGPPRVLNMAGLTTSLPAIAATLSPLIEAVPLPVPAAFPLVDDSALRGLGWAPARSLADILTDTLADMRKDA